MVKEREEDTREDTSILKPRVKHDIGNANDAKRPF